MRFFECMALSLAFLPAAQAGTLVFDTISGNPDISVGGTPRTYMGQDFNAADPGGPLLIERVLVLMGSTATQSYTNIRASVQLWDTYGIDPVYAIPAGSVHRFDLGPMSLAAFFAYDVDLVFPTPIPMTGLNLHGIAINFQGDTGAGLFDTDNLTTIVRYGAVPIAVGSNPSVDGYWRNASGRTDFNFDLSDFRFFTGGNSALALQIYATGVPEPSTFALAGFAALAFFTRRSRRA